MTDHVKVPGPENHVRDHLSSYLNGDLPDSERRDVESHLATCQACRDDLASLRLTVDALRRLPNRAVPRDFSIPTVTTPTVATRRRIFAPRFQVPVGALAAALVVIIGYRLFFQPALNLATPTEAPAAPFAQPAAPNPAAAPAAAPTAAPAAAAAPAAPAISGGATAPIQQPSE